MLFSVIIPTFNRAEYIKHTIDSVLEQTFKEYEIIVIDDGSIDNTRESLKEYGDKIRYFYQSNNGVSAARDHGIREARGEWVAFLDDDDLWEPNKLEIQMEYLKQNPGIDFVYSDARVFCENNIISETFKRPYFDNYDVFYSLLKSDRIFIGTVICRKEVLKSIGNFDGALNMCEDWDMFLRVSQRYNVGYVDKVLVSVRSHDSNLSGNVERMNLKILKLLKKTQRNMCLKGKYKRRVKEKKQEINFDLGYHYYKIGKIRQAYKCFFNSLVTSRFLDIDAFKYAVFTWIMSVFSSSRNNRIQKNKKPVIGYYSDTKQLGGSEVYLKVILGNIDTSLYEPVLFLTDSHPLSEWVRDVKNFRVITLNGISSEQNYSRSSYEGSVSRDKERKIQEKFLQSIWRKLPVSSLKLFVGTLKEIMRLKKLFKQNKVDIIHFNDTGCEPPVIAARLAGILNVIGTYHVVPSNEEKHSMWVHRLIEYFSVRCMHNAISVSEATKQEWVKRTGVNDR
ncbi:glycosyltransferase, partial [Candidatus Pacearchaeota archaeon]|nr:glycosyltransferase [Candidatus Pacearchaeota archaeon]